MTAMTAMTAMTGARASASPRWLQGLSIVVMGVTLLKGIAFPHAWAASHFLFDYERGFVKRGLMGALLRATGVEMLRSYQFVFYFNVIILAANLVLVGLAFSELHRSRRGPLLLAPMVYATSLAVAYLGNTIGYFDHLGLLAALVALRLDDFRRRTIFTGAAMGTLVFVHEATAVIFLPVVLFASLLAPGDRRRDARRLVVVGVVVVLIAVITHFVSNATISRADAEGMFREAQASANFRVERGAFDVLHRTSRDNLAIMTRAWGKARHWREVAFSLVTTLPASVALLAIAVAAMRRAGLRWWRCLAGVAAGLSPLALHAAGWDIHRWNALAITTCFLLVFAVHRHAPAPDVGDASDDEAPPSVSAWLAARGAFGSSGRLLPGLAVAAVIVNLSGDIGFLNRPRGEHFPYRGHVHYWEQVASGVEEFPARPLRVKRIEAVRGAAIAPPSARRATRVRARRVDPRTQGALGR